MRIKLQKKSKKESPLVAVGCLIGRYSSSSSRSRFRTRAPLLAATAAAAAATLPWLRTGEELGHTRLSVVL